MQFLKHLLKRNGIVKTRYDLHFTVNYIKK
jgi:hypothetical protein